MSDRVKSRRYDSTGRQEAARLRRLRMIEAATSLFLDDGYAQTSMARIAERAGVSADLLFKVFGSKRELMRAVLDVTVGGDDEEVPLLQREGPQQLKAETDQRRQVALLATGMVDQMARLRPVDDMLRGAAVVDSGLAELHCDLHDRQRRAAMREIAGWLAARGPLAVSLEEAATTLWVLTSPEVHRLLVDESGLSATAYVAWLEQAISGALLPPTRTARR